ncbi:metallophosphoesterase family protein [Candidatus Bipolaricaulota bacterium]
MRKNRCLLTLLLVVAACVCGFGSQADEIVRIGIVTDVHVHDVDSPAEGKVMTNHAERLTAFVEAMNAWPADAIVQLGDLINGNFVMGALGDPARIPDLLAAAATILNTFAGPVHHVGGNHDFYDLSFQEYTEILGLETIAFSFDLGGFHFAVLDAEHEPDGSHYDHVFLRVKGHVPPSQLEWLRDDLAGTELPTIVLIHQPLDSDFDALAGGPPVANHLDVRAVLAESGAVVAVFQGHDHENRHSVIDGIHYVTFAAMVDHTEPSPPTWAQVIFDPASQTITIEGFGDQESYEFSYGESD